MDPITALLNLTTEVLAIMGKMIDGQTPAQRQELWAWFIADQERWRKFLNLDK